MCALYSLYEGNQSLKDKATIDSFIHECNRIEEQFTEGGGTHHFLPLYQSQNAFNQSEVLSYWYQAVDLHAIQSHLFKEKNRKYHVLEPIGAGQLTKKRLAEIRTLLQKQDVVFSVYNIADLHWVAFCLIKEPGPKLSSSVSDSSAHSSSGNLEKSEPTKVGYKEKNSDKITVLYKDSFGRSDKELEDILRTEFASLEFKSHPSKEQTTDSSSCGIMALENVRIMKNQLMGSNRTQFIAQFTNFRDFCKLDKAKALRKDEFCRAYVHGINGFMEMEAIRAEKARQIRQHHQAELDEVAKQLRTNSDKRIRSLGADVTLDRREEKNTIALEIGVDDLNFQNGDYQYHIRIFCTHDLTIQSVKAHLLSFNFLGLEENAYKIEDNTIKISPGLRKPN
jgi:hypothetical protein